jgi:hypothetical protein
VWVAGVWPNRPPVRRALRWDGLFPIDLPGPEALAELAAEVREARPGGGPFDLITELPLQEVDAMGGPVLAKGRLTGVYER